MSKLRKLRNVNRQGLIKLLIILLIVAGITILTLVVILLILNAPPINNS